MQNSLPEILPLKADLAYRRNISKESRFSWIIKYKYSDIFISCDKDLRDRSSRPLISFYNEIESVIDKDRDFLESLIPLKDCKTYPETASMMCESSKHYGVGPMACVAGAACEVLADALSAQCSELIIENGGDTLIIGKGSISVGLFVKNDYFKDKIKIKSTRLYERLSICSSSSTFGHSRSLGDCDLAVAISPSAYHADSAATAIANSIRLPEDLDSSIERFSNMGTLTGILIIKGKKIGIWGQIELI